MAQVKMPQLGETVVEGTITRWLKQEGETVDVDEPLVEVSTDKVDSEIPSPAAGKVVKIMAQEGDTVKVGAVLAEISADGQAAAEEPAAEEPEEPAPTEEEPAPPEEPEPTEEEPAAEKPSVQPRRPAAEQPPAEAPPKQAPPREIEAEPAANGRRQVAASEEEPRRGILSPLVRKMAAEAGVDLEMVKGTGTGGRITKQDVLDFVDARRSGKAPGAPAQAPAAPSRPAAEAAAPARAEPPTGTERRPVERAPAASAGDEVVEMTHMRKAIADHMVKSHITTARAWNAVEVDLTKVGSLRQLAGPEFRKREGFSLTWMPFVAKAICQSLLRFPQINSTWNDDGTITRKHYVNLGIAVALENGLIVPVVKGADGMNISGLARSIRDIAERARSKKLNPDEVHGGTFTITNPGPFGSLVSLPIINQGQTGILAFDAVVKRPVVVTDENGSDAIAIRQMVFLSMSWDHRVIDGAEAAQFLSHLKQLLEEADFESDLSAYLPEKS